MNLPNDSCTGVSRFFDTCRNALSSNPCHKGTVVVARAPGSADVMGGIVEDSGALVLTTTLALAINAAIWHVAGDHVRILLTAESPHRANNGQGAELRLPVAAFDPSAGGPAALLNKCREAGAEWAAPSCLAIRQAIAEGLVPKLSGGLMVLLQSNFPTDADLGRRWVKAAATVEGLCRLLPVQADPLQKSRVCADAVMPLTGLYNLRTPMTALCGPADGALLQLRFYPQPLCQVLELPPGIIILAATTKLTRPTTPQRLVETQLCAEMGRRLIARFQQADGNRIDPAARLSAITPAEYVERYRDRLPSKITGKAYVSRFGEVRGLNGELNPQAIYKVRSRAEHHIYENKRVHEFATSIARAKRTSSAEALTHAGELMYASHWSHSQRCGIGGVEADQLVTAIRAHGPQAGLFGAKVTAGGEGGELVVLMRDEPRSHEALAQAIAQAETVSKRSINIYRGPTPGADVLQAPELADSLASATSA